MPRDDDTGDVQYCQAKHLGTGVNIVGSIAYQ